MVDLTLEVTHELKDRSPVDLGWLQSNWVPNIGVPYPAVDGERTAGVGHTGGAASAAGEAALIGGAYRLDRGPIYITNNVEYGPVVDARQPFVEDAIDAGARAFAASHSGRHRG